MAFVLFLFFCFFNRRFIHISFFVPAPLLLTHLTPSKRFPTQFISTNSVFTSIFFVIVCCLIMINVITL